MLADQHYWRTADGRLVPTGHLDAETLVYPKGGELPDDVARELGLLEPSAKQATAPANKQTEKQADKPVDKSRRPGADK